MLNVTLNCVQIEKAHYYYANLLGNHVLSFSSIQLPYVEELSKGKEKDLSVQPWDYYSDAVASSDNLLISVYGMNTC